LDFAAKVVTHNVGGKAPGLAAPLDAFQVRVYGVRTKGPAEYCSKVASVRYGCFEKITDIFGKVRVVKFH
jgi:hypothetical protein